MSNIPFYDDYCEELELNEKLIKENKILKNYSKSIEKSYNNLEKNFDDRVQKEAEKIRDVFAEQLIEKDRIIDEKNKEIDRLRALLNTDGTNSGIPTSQTPINKKKVIPNSRKKSGKKKGGQLNHKKHSLQKFNDDEVTDVVEHNIEECPVCGGDMVPTGNFIMWSF